MKKIVSFAGFKGLSRCCSAMKREISCLERFALCPQPIAFLADLHGFRGLAVEASAWRRGQLRLRGALRRPGVASSMSYPENTANPVSIAARTIPPKMRVLAIPSCPPLNQSVS